MRDLHIRNLSIFYYWKKISLKTLHFRTFHWSGLCCTFTVNAGNKDVVPKLLGLMKKATDLRKEKFYTVSESSKAKKYVFIHL